MPARGDDDIAAEPEFACDFSGNRADDGARAKRTGQALFFDCIAEHYFRSRYYYLCKHWNVGTAMVVEAGELVLLALRALVRQLRGAEDSAGFRERLTGPFFATPASPLPLPAAPGAPERAGAAD